MCCTMPFQSYHIRPPATTPHYTTPNIPYPNGMHQTFWFSSGTRWVHNKQWMVKWYLFKCQLFRSVSQLQKIIIKQTKNQQIGENMCRRLQLLFAHKSSFKNLLGISSRLTSSLEPTNGKTITFSRSGRPVHDHIENTSDCLCWIQLKQWCIR
jgi:hypothetical protein